MYLRLLYECAEKTTSVFKVTEDNKKIVEQRIRVRKLQRERIRRMIYKMLGDDGKNSSMEIIIEDVLDEFEKSKRLFNGNNINPNDIKEIINRLYEKLGAKYNDGKLNDLDLKSSAKALYNNILVKDDMNMKDEFKDIMKSFNIDDLDMNDPNIMEKLEKVVEENPNITEKLKKVVEENPELKKAVEENPELKKTVEENPNINEK
jgi:hypothetical protein